MRARVAVMILSMAVLLAPTAARWASGSGLTTLPVAQEPAGAQDTQQSFYVGARSCSAEGCHGNSLPTDPAERKRSAQTEFRTWKDKDKHSQAYAVLKNDLSQQIAKHLKLDAPPEKSDRCLNCHSMNALPERRAISFSLEDGVSCDGCHGPASRWGISHALPNQSYADSLKDGMKDIRNPIVRAEMCLSCHLGNRKEGKIVDHEMYAAGHPPLTFEVDAFSHKLPPHWREKKPADNGNLPRAQLWAIGQVVALREAARLLAADASKGPWPEYAHFDCAACHHDLKDDDWRQHRPREGPPGRPLWQAGSAGRLVRQLTDGESVAQSLVKLQGQFESVAFGKAPDLATIAERLEEELFQLANNTSTHTLSAADTRKLAATLCDAAEPIAWRGPNAARQLSFALAALLSQLVPADSKLLAELEQLQSDFSASSATSRYDPREFTRRIASIRQQLPAN